MPASSKSASSGAPHPETGRPRFWAIRLTVGRNLGPVLEEALSGVAGSVSRFEENPQWPEPSNAWRIEAICDFPPDRAGIEALLAATAEAMGAPTPRFEIKALDDVDWLALNRRQFPPVSAGRFFVHGSHFDGEPPEGKVAICLDAGPAFGSGTHGSTQGALMAIERLAGLRPWRRVLDLGCGSGILSLALAAVTDAEILASDMEAAARDNVSANAAANGVGSRITAVQEHGVGARVREYAPYDLVAANILAEPLISMVGDIAEVTTAEGAVILSGLIAAQEGDVLAAYRSAGFHHLMTLALGPWSTLVVTRRPGSGPER
jgi:ribosomal protein L11 methyltransferase